MESLDITVWIMFMKFGDNLESLGRNREREIKESGESRIGDQMEPARKRRLSQPVHYCPSYISITCALVPQALSLSFA